MTAIAFSLSIGPVPLAVTVSETHDSKAEITSNPIESGSSVNDHAYLLSKKVTLDIAGRFAAVTYNLLLNFQAKFEPFTLVTGLKVYSNMLIKNISTTRDKDNARILRATIDLEEVVIVSTATTTVDVDETGQQSPAQQGSQNSTRAATPTKESTAPPKTPTQSSSVTQDRATGTVQRGDTPAKTVKPLENRSLLSRAFG